MSLFDIPITEKINITDSKKNVLDYCRQKVRDLIKTTLQATENPIISHKESGAPFLPDYPDTNLSISHTNDMVAVIVSYNHNVGIDVEKISDRLINVLTRITTIEERLLLNIHNQEEATVVFSAKEAAYKAMSYIGNSITDFIIINMDRTNQLLTMRHRVHNCDNITVHYKRVENHILCWTLA